jgi:hypothetical protein
MSAKNKFSQEKYGPEMEGKRALFLLSAATVSGPEGELPQKQAHQAVQGHQFLIFR